MYSSELDIAIENFSKAVKYAIQVLPKENIYDYLVTVEKTDLQLLLSIYEYQEEYEFCAIIAKALKEQQN